MKIYIEDNSRPALSFLTLAKDNKNASKVNKILQKIDKYLIKKQHIIDIYSKQGIYQVNENQTHKLYIKSEKTHENITMNTNNNELITLVFDDSVIEKELVHQLPYEHVNIPLNLHCYSLNKNTLGLVLVIEFIENDKGELRPINYYFECNPKSGYTNLPIEEINVFLSLLN